MNCLKALIAAIARPAPPGMNHAASGKPLGVILAERLAELGGVYGVEQNLVLDLGLVQAGQGVAVANAYDSQFEPSPAGLRQIGGRNSCCFW